ncbi:hypothetical protein N9519_02865 [Candidatus Thioglobus sp.]|nr:hypothetical protein [Candidatus Thioglobus sp.]
MLIYLAPGIAFFPKFILNPRTFAVIPFISISIVVSAQYLLSTLNQFSHQNVVLLICFTLIIALYRLYSAFKDNLFTESNWHAKDYKALLLIVFSSIPLMIILGFEGFQHADEIYSWNMWAKQIYLNQTVTFDSTQSPYPLALPSLIAFCYKFLGNTDYQLPIKFSYSIIYISTIFAIYSFAKTREQIGIFFITYLIVMLIIGIGFEYKKVYADTLMGGFLTTSLVLIISLSKRRNRINKNISEISILIASILLICFASLTKQGAMVWAILPYPLLAYVVINTNNNLTNYLKALLLIPILTPFLWYFFGGKDFYQNIDVINRSMANRDYLEQFFYGFEESFISNPTLLMFMVVVFIVLFKKIDFEKTIFLFGIILSTLLLIFFGAYETTRLYLHIILAGWLLIISYGDDILSNKFTKVLSKIGRSLYLYAFIGSLFLFWSVNSFYDRIILFDRISNFLDGREVQANWIIGESGAEQYRNIIKSKKGLVAQNGHIWGMYYGMDNFHYKGFGLTDEKIHAMAQDIINKEIGWMYSYDEQVKILENFCPGSVNKVNTSENLYNQTLYKISNESLTKCVNK